MRISGLVDPLPRELHLLAIEAQREGHRFLDRMIREWTSGRQRFDRAGEYLLGVWQADRLIACGGICRDPYVPGAHRVGRLRHVYVHPACRRQGIGGWMVSALLDAGHEFERIRLRTPGTMETADFYSRLGFSTVDEPEATHAWARDSGQ